MCLKIYFLFALPKIPQVLKYSQNENVNTRLVTPVMGIARLSNNLQFKLYTKILFNVKIMKNLIQRKL